MNRATMLAGIDRLTQYMRRPPQSGELFESREDRLLDIELMPMQDWDLATRLWNERKVLGTWISGHPMQLVAGRYEHKCEFRLRDIPDLLDRTSEAYCFAFIVQRVVVTNKIVIIVAEDETGIEEISAFKTDCDPWWHLLKRDMILIAQCVPKHNINFKKMTFLKLHKLGQLSEPTNLFVPQ